MHIFSHPICRFFRNVPVPKCKSSPAKGASASSNFRLYTNLYPNSFSHPGHPSCTFVKLARGCVRIRNCGIIFSCTVDWQDRKEQKNSRNSLFPVMQFKKSCPRRVLAKYLLCVFVSQISPQNWRLQKQIFIPKHIRILYEIRKNETNKPEK